jgi:ABC-2 type transport system ATP-binding protein
MSSLALETINLVKDFSGKRAVDNLNLRINQGDIYGFLGPNGSGKTTTLRMILGLIRPTNGTINVQGMDVRRNYSKIISDIGAIIENPSFYLYLTARENLKIISHYPPYVNDKKRIDEVLETVKLTDAANKKVKTYSLGMKQRLGIAMALLKRPKTIILDEPTNGLDPYGIKEMREIIKDLNQESQITCIISSHLLSEVELSCNRVGIIQSGKLLIEEKLEDLTKADTVNVKISTLETSKVINLLKDTEFTKFINACNNGVEVQIRTDAFSELNSMLVNNNIQLSGVAMRQPTLEDIFLKYTVGGK